MRMLWLALILTLFAGAVSAAPTKKKASQSPPTAQPDTSLVSPDDAPPPPTYAVSSRTVEMGPIAAPEPKAVASQATQSAPIPPPPPAAPPKPAVIAQVEMCLRAEAPRAAKAEASVKMAVDLMLDDLCGAEVDRASLFARNTEALAHFTPLSERAAAGLSGAKVDPQTGEIINPPAGDVTGALTSTGLDRASVDVPPQLRRFAAELVIQAKGEPAAQPLGAKKAH